MKSNRKPLGYYSKKNFKEREMEHELGQPRAKFLRLKFGKYRGYNLKDVPTPYLNWILLNFNESTNKTLFKQIKSLLGLTNYKG